MKKNVFIIICTIISLFIFIISKIVIAQDGGKPVPGSKEDPIIVESYLTQEVIPQINNYINEKNQSLEEKIQVLEQKSSFKVVTLEKGEKLICSEGTELILRMGKASAITSELGGLSDVTQGTDIMNTENIPSNHLLIVPRDDGRGIEALEDVIVLVKGLYEIK